MRVPVRSPNGAERARCVRAICSGATAAAASSARPWACDWRATPNWPADALHGIRAPDAGALFARRAGAWMSWVVNHKVRGVVVAIDGTDTGCCTASCPRARISTHWISRLDPRPAGRGRDFAYEVLHHEDWIGRRLVAQRFRDGGCSSPAMPPTLWVPPLPVTAAA